MLLNAAIHWPEVVDLQSWQFAIQSVYLWNFLLHPETKLSPLEYVSQSHVSILHIFSGSIYGVDLHLFWILDHKMARNSLNGLLDSILRQARTCRPNSRYFGENALQ